MYEYQHIIRRLRSGQSQRSIAKAKLVSRETLKKVVKVAEQYDWLNPDVSEPSPSEIKRVFKSLRKKTGQENKILPYK